MLPSIKNKNSELNLFNSIEDDKKQTLMSPSKMWDSDDPFYDIVRSKHPRSLNYNEASA